MTAYTRRAVPWGAVACGSAGAPALLALAAADPSALWPVQGVAIGLLAATAAWSMDERAAAIVDTLPRGLAWRTLGRAPAVVLPALAWLVAVLTLAPRLPDHAGLFVLQGVAASAAGMAVSTVRRAGREAAPGIWLAPVAVTLAAVLALVRPLPDRVPLFPVWPDEAWALSWAIWWSVAAAAAGLLMWALTRP